MREQAILRWGMKARATTLRGSDLAPIHDLAEAAHPVDILWNVASVRIGR